LSGQRLYREAIERENIKGGGFSFYVWRSRFEGGEKKGGGGGEVSGEKGNIDSIQSFQGGAGSRRERKK
jgi:hypothetical protein